MVAIDVSCCCDAVFDDGDENTLRRSKLCLKGSRHFIKSDVSDFALCLSFLPV